MHVKIHVIIISNKYVCYYLVNFMKNLFSTNLIVIMGQRVRSNYDFLYQILEFKSCLHWGVI